jgi:hypothetical protein
MPVRKRATIAHISDLHINRKVDTHVLDMLAKVLKTEVKPDVLVISGDLANQPLPWQMKKAAEEVRKLENSCKPIRTIVIPGNHDFKFWGNVGVRRLTRIPFEIYFRRDGLNLKPFSRAGLALKLVFDAFSIKGQAMREPIITEFFTDRPEMGLAIFAINSNTLTEMMAAGKVEAQDLQDLYQAIGTENESATFPFVYKVAVVHHHPAPIANAPAGALDRLQDSFMIFYNAGLFVRELSRRGFNLVLHGHRHVAGFTRVGCEFEDHGRTVLPIAAAGTASHPSPDDERGNHLNVIEVYDDDTAKLHQWFFSKNVEKKDESRTWDLDTIQDVRIRRNAVFKRLQGYFVHEVRKSAEITSDGYTKVNMEFLNAEIVSKTGLNSIPITLTAPRPSYLRDLRPSTAASAFEEINLSNTSLYELRGELALADHRTARQGPFGFGYSYRLMNGHALTSQEFARHYAGTDIDSEWVSITPGTGCEIASLQVQFPEQSDITHLEFRALAEYVEAPLRGVADSRLDEEMRQHDSETERIKGNIRLVGSHTRELTCPNPVPGMTYKLCWKFRSEVKNAELAINAEILEAREKLIDLTRADVNLEKTQSYREHLKAVIDPLVRDIDRKMGADQEDLRLDVMVFDEAAKRLKFVYSTAEDLPSGDFYSGEGCAGVAFEKARCIVYHPDRDPLGIFIRREEWIPPRHSGDPVVLICFPWIHESLVIGVVNVASHLRKTKFLSLFDDPQAADKIKMLQDLVNVAMLRFIRVK